MHIRFAEVDEEFIKNQVEQGLYISELELVRDAVRRLREEKSYKMRFYNAVMLGEEDIKAGRVFDYTPELIAKIRQEAIEDAKNNKPFENTDALPFD